MEPYHFENLTYTYPGAAEAALKDVSFTVEPGEFIVVCGPSGSGKTTLLRQLKEKNPEFGFVMQNPQTQTVTDTVLHELAFGMESQGVLPERMWHAIAETAVYFGMEDWLEREMFSLSGGETQLVNLAAVLAMDPPVILLDEPTSQLDPMAATEFLEAVKRLNAQMGITIIMIEQRLEEVLAACDRMLVLNDGCVMAYGSVKDVYETICRAELENEKAHYSGQYLSYMPSYVRLYAAANVSTDECPQSVKECRKWFNETKPELSIWEKSLSREKFPEKEMERGELSGACSVACEHVFFRYERTGRDILKDVQYCAYPGHIFGIVGGNGSGKSTFLKVLTGAKRHYHGKVKVDGEVAYLPQEPKYLFIQDKVKDIVTTREAIEKFGLDGLLERHPYDMSGGQMQRLAMAYLYEKDASVYLFDEPTKGLDPDWKRMFGTWLEEMAGQGKTVIVVTHDVEFAANYCQWISMCFHAELTEPMRTVEFFKGHHFYTTAIHKIVKERYPDLVSERSLYEK